MKRSKVIFEIEYVDPLSPEFLKAMANATGNSFPTKEMIDRENKMFERLYPLTPDECYPIGNEGILAQIQKNGENISYDSKNMPKLDEIINILKKKKYPTE